jgi:hypothetical protein
VKEDDMVEHREITEAKTTADPAAQAFEALRQEVALLRRAVTGLAADQSSIEMPDYSETLGVISRMVSSIGKRLVALSEMPAFGYTPQDWSHKIEIASEEARRKDREAIVLSGEILRKTTEDLTRSLMSAREAAKQQRLLLWTGVVGVLAGMLLWALCIGPAIHAIL